MNDIHTRINDGEFDTKLPYGPSIEERKAHRADEERLVRVFREEMASINNLADHPKEPVLWRLAWEHGHSAGLNEVVHYYEEFADLLTPLTE